MSFRRLFSYSPRCLAPILIIATASLAPNIAQAQDNGSTANGRASATIVEPLRVIAISDLNFGWIAAPVAGSGTVTISPMSGTGTYSGVRPITCGQQSCTPNQAQFRVYGVDNRQYRISLPDSATAFAQDGSGDALAVTDLNASSSNLPGGGNYGLLDGEGEDLLGVGGTLNVPSSATPGQYVARIIVVVSYS